MDLVNNNLDYAKAEAGMIRLAYEMVALPELVRLCITMLEPKAGQAGVRITAHIDADVPEIVADPLRLRQILINLLSNAVKFTKPGGSVKLHVRPSDRDVLISVRDTGRGLTAEQMERLFDPYYQAAQGDQGIGTGLGLAIVRHLVQLHEGSISVESVPSVGTCFTVRLPRTCASIGRIDGSARRIAQQETMAGLWVEPAVEHVAS
jgi:signal transduction histidine kinase